MITCEVIFKGRVQGVGFRCTARDMAREAGVAGWVRNCSDGSVQLLAEGEEADIEVLIHQLEVAFSVGEKKVIRSSLTHGWSGFSIKY